MVVLRLTDSRPAPPTPGDMLVRHAALVAAVKDGRPGHLDVQLAQASDQTWTGVGRWDFLASGQSASGLVSLGCRPGIGQRTLREPPWSPLVRLVKGKDGTASFIKTRNQRRERMVMRAFRALGSHDTGPVVQLAASQLAGR